MTDHTQSPARTYFYAYDGNGNVAGLVDAADGTLAAQYEYGPFHELIRASGPLARVNPFLAASKYYDWETELYYYGFRYYHPGTGRWLSRDPIGELGGMNLYGFVNGNPQRYVDVLGLHGLAPLIPVADTVIVGAEAGSLGGPLGALTVAIAAYAGAIIATDLALLTEIYQSSQETKEIEKFVEEQKELYDELTESETEPEYVPPRIYKPVKEIQDNKTCCRFVWDGRNLGGNSKHNAYTKRLFKPNYELVVIAPDGDNARYDSGATYPEPVTNVYEAKTGRRWAFFVARPDWNYVMKKIHKRDIAQFTKQKRVAKKCILSYTIIFENSYGLQGYQIHAPEYSSHYKHIP